MTDNLFNPEAFEQMAGQMSMADVAENPQTWDGEPMFSPETVREALVMCDDCGAPATTARWTMLLCEHCCYCRLGRP